MNASKIGAIAELVDHYHTGLCFQPGDAGDLVTQVQWLRKNSDRLPQMRHMSRTKFETKFNTENNYKKISRNLSNGKPLSI